MKLVLPCYYHPTTVVLVDDNEKFLKSICLQLDDQVIYKTFTDAREAVRFLNEQCEPNPAINRAMVESEDEADHLLMNVCTRSIRNEVYRPRRFEEVTVVVVDYAMPGLNGLEVCEQIKHPHIRKIMLTGEADESLATQAFNRGLLDKFIVKSAFNLADEVNQAIFSMQNRYFIELTERIMSSVLCKQQPILQNLFDLNFSYYFRRICRKNNIVEYYLTDNHGGFLLLDAEGKPSWLAVNSTETLAQSYDFAQGADNVSGPVLQALQQGSKIPYFFGDEDLNVPPSQWEAYLHLAERIGSQTDYYVSYIDRADVYRFNSTGLLSYSDFLKGH